MTTCFIQDPNAKGKADLKGKLQYAGERGNRKGCPLSQTKVLYPIKKEYVKRIFDGSKAYEFRKSFCNPDIDTMVIYESKGRGKIVGECKIVGRICCDPEKMWTLCKEYAGIDKKDFFEYFNCCDKACAYVIGDVNIFLVPRTLADYGIDFPPQNYYYIKD